MKTSWKFWLFLILATLSLLFLGDMHLRATATRPQNEGLLFDVSDPVLPALSAAVRALVPRHAPSLAREVNPLQWFGAGVGEGGAPIGLDPLAARSVNSGTTPLPLVTFEGLPSLSGFIPPDTNGEVGPNHYVQMTNITFQIWDKGDPDHGVAPTPLIPPTALGALFAALGEDCQLDWGDPVVVYDDLADRWLLSQMNLSSFGLCLAVSTTPDPTGTYSLYHMPMPDIPDYPRYGVWPAAYFIGTNSGFPNQYYVHAFDRAAMLAGAPATRQSFGGLVNLMLPADVDGPTAPPVETPGIFYTFFHPDATGHPAGEARLAFFEFEVDWATPANSSYTLAAELPVAPFNYTICGFFAWGCLTQPGTSQLLMDIAWWPMYRLQYRNFGNYAAMVGNFTVDADGQDHAGIRWFEVRKTNATYALYQEGTYFPDTGSRWMGAIAMDARGNLALGYSISSETMLPSIRYATRLASDPLGTLNLEAELWSGGGVQTSHPYWGDYSSLSVDPGDGCHFWYTSEYHDVNDAGYNWNTRIGVFRLPECGLAPTTGVLAGTVTEAETGEPLAGTTLTAAGPITNTTTTGASGQYTLTLPVGDYEVTATAPGYLSQTVTGVAVLTGTTTTQDFALASAWPNLVTEGTFEVTLGPDMLVTQTLTLRNTGTNPLLWTLQEGVPGAVPTAGACVVGDLPWVSVSPASGTTPGSSSSDVAVVFDSAGLSAGVSLGSLCLSSNDPDSPWVTLPLTLTVDPAADLGLTKTAPVTVTVGTPFTYTLTVTNVGPGLALTTTLTDTLPTGVNFLRASTGCIEAGGVVTCVLGNLMGGSQVTVSIAVTAEETGLLTNTAFVRSATVDPHPADNSASVNTEMVAAPPEAFNLYLPLVIRE